MNKAKIINKKSKKGRRYDIESNTTHDNKLNGKSKRRTLLDSRKHTTELLNRKYARILHSHKTQGKNILL